MHDKHFATLTVPRKFVSHKNLNKDGFNFAIWHPQISD